MTRQNETPEERETRIEKEQFGCLLAVLGPFAALFADNNNNNDSNEATSPEISFPYDKKKYLLTKAERSFYKVLRQTIDTENQYRLFTKVRIADLLQVRKNTEKPTAHFNKISAKHVDFVLCDGETLTPILAIELDDSSHKRRKVRQRDAFVDAAFKAAGMPILHVEAQQAYSTKELAAAVRGAANPNF